jgi:hypothetical protein
LRLPVSLIRPTTAQDVHHGSRKHKFDRIHPRLQGFGRAVIPTRRLGGYTHAPFQVSRLQRRYVCGHVVTSVGSLLLIYLHARSPFCSVAWTVRHARVDVHKSGAPGPSRAQRRLGPASGSGKLLIMITGIYSRPAARDQMPPGEALRRHTPSGSESRRVPPCTPRRGAAQPWTPLNSV